MHYRLSLGKHESKAEGLIWTQGALKTALGISFHRIGFYSCVLTSNRIELVL